MNQDYMEIRYCSPKTGYITECINAQTPQGAINLIRARVPDASIASIKYHSAPAAVSRPDDGGGSTGRRP